MQEQLTLAELKIKKATQNDWQETLKLLEDVGLTFWFTGGENYKTFYIVSDPETKKIICCFSIVCENDIGILKSFAIKKDLQGRGIGKYIANKTPEVAKSQGIKKLYAASKEAPQFWQKTVFKELTINEVKDNFFLDYLNGLKDRINDYYQCTHFFLKEID